MEDIHITDSRDNSNGNNITTRRRTQKLRPDLRLAESYIPAVFTAIKVLVYVTACVITYGKGYALAALPLICLYYDHLFMASQVFHQHSYHYYVSIINFIDSTSIVADVVAGTFATLYCYCCNGYNNSSGSICWMVAGIWAFLGCCHIHIGFFLSRATCHFITAVLCITLLISMSEDMKINFNHHNNNMATTIATAAITQNNNNSNINFLLNSYSYYSSFLSSISQWSMFTAQQQQQQPSAAIVQRSSTLFGVLYIRVLAYLALVLLDIYTIRPPLQRESDRINMLRYGSVLFAPSLSITGFVFTFLFAAVLARLNNRLTTKTISALFQFFFGSGAAADHHHHHSTSSINLNTTTASSNNNTAASFFLSSFIQSFISSYFINEEVGYYSSSLYHHSSSASPSLPFSSSSFEMSMKPSTIIDFNNNYNKFEIGSASCTSGMINNRFQPSMLGGGGSTATTTTSSTASTQSTPTPSNSNSNSSNNNNMPFLSPTNSFQYHPTTHFISGGGVCLQQHQQPSSSSLRISQQPSFSSRLLHGSPHPAAVAIISNPTTTTTTTTTNNNNITPALGQPQQQPSTSTNTLNVDTMDVNEAFRLAKAQYLENKAA